MTFDLVFHGPLAAPAVGCLVLAVATFRRARRALVLSLLLPGGRSAAGWAGARR